VFRLLMIPADLYSLALNMLHCIGLRATCVDLMAIGRTSPQVWPIVMGLLSWSLSRVDQSWRSLISLYSRSE
jgi:hypothetical protein